MCQRVLRTLMPATAARSSDVQRVERLQATRPGGNVHIPSLYVINAAALSKPHAIEQLSVDLRSYNIDIAAVTERHFKAKHLDSVVAIPDYTLIRRDRSGRRGGGVAIYVRTSLKAEIWQYSYVRVLWITFGNLFVDVVYHP